MKRLFALSLALVSEKELTVSGRDALAIEYEGSVQGRPMRWLSLAVLDADRVFVVTYTTPSDGHAGLEKEPYASLDSFKIGE